MEVEDGSLIHNDTGKGAVAFGRGGKGVDVLYLAVGKDGTGGEAETGYEGWDDFTG